jgi:endophilin-A
MDKVANMAFLPGLKKQINKANQFMSEKISGVEGTKLDDDFYTMERKTDLFIELVEDLQIKTKEYLQPNPTVRAKMAAVKGISKLSGQAKASTYPQPEGTLGEAMGNFGRKLQEFDNGSVFAASLIESGESLKQMADLKYALDDNVKQNYLEPLHHLQTKDLKEVAHHRKKLMGRKLDFDCKKRKQQSGSAVTEKEIKQAEDKFSESLHLAQMGMHNIMENDIEQISQMTQFAEALLEYHKQCTNILQGLTDTLYEKTNDASARPRRDFNPKTLEDLGVDTGSDYNLAAPNIERSLRPSSSNSNLPTSGNLISTSASASPAGTPQQPSAPSSGFGDWSNPTPSPRHSPATTPTRASQPTCQALYDFDPENAGELGFKEGDVIHLKQKVDDNWFEGMLKGRTGYFPITYVTVLVPLP